MVVGGRQRSQTHGRAELLFPLLLEQLISEKKNNNNKNIYTYIYIYMGSSVVFLKIETKSPGAFLLYS